ncbi:prolyl oligopeptidase family serine peptidase [Ferruginibacter sp. SUN106]|uniref:prolyl oligopeptidase family serine peptidase n=1 Tax=Ferruginibacter sp. SUN106 TaxID=2978348 RepID=UPI003D369131
MKKTIIIIVTVCIYSLCTAQYKYPFTKTVDSSDTWHNVTIKDSYRWMEDLKSDETKNWFKAQNDYTSSIMDKLPMTDELYKDFLKLDSIQPDKIGKVRQVGNTLFYFNLKVGDAKPKMYKRNGESGKEELLADNTRWGSNYMFSDYEIDPYEKFIAITAGEGGKEITAVTKFYNITTGKFLIDSLPGRYAGYAPGEGNVYYMQQPTWDVHAMVEDKDRVYKVHKLGTDTLQDEIFLSYKLNPELYSMDNTMQLSPAWLDKDCNYECVFASSVSPYPDIYYRKINSGAPWKKVISIQDEITTVNASGNKLFMVSKKNAPNGKILFMDMANPDVAKAKLIAPEKDIPLEMGNGLTQSKNFLIVPYMKNGVQLFHYTVDMRTNKFSKIPFVENTNLLYITPFNKRNDDVHLVRSGWTTPITFSYSNLDKPFAKEKIFSFRTNPKFPYTDEVVVDEIEIAGHDGVLVPVSVIHKKDVKLNGENTAYVYSYGAYGISSSAGFNPDFLLLAHKGIVIAVAHVRGGGEKGENWHLSGYKQSKPNTWKDLNSTAEYLISKGYTSPAHLACEGGSAGGILIGRAITERPDLWACAIPQVGCLSMVRQEFAPNGPVNTPEFGTVKNINEFFALMEMDATLHVQAGTKYPAMLITTGWNDPRVISWQPAKFAAAVQQANTSDKPILLQVDYNAGHGDSEDKFAAFRKEAKKWAFILEQTGYIK